MRGCGEDLAQRLEKYQNVVQAFGTPLTWLGLDLLPVQKVTLMEKKGVLVSSWSGGSGALLAYEDLGQVTIEGVQYVLKFIKYLVLLGASSKMEGQQCPARLHALTPHRTLKQRKVTTEACS